MIVDDHEIVRSGLAVFLETCEDLEKAGEAADGQTALLLCEENAPDIVLMDIVMPGMGGIEATRRIRERFENIQVIGLTSYENEDLVSDMLDAGAIGYLLKDVSIEDLAAAIRDAHAGQSTLAPVATQVLIDGVRKPDVLREPLTERERDVLSLMVKGMNNREIGEKLFISTSTVKNHVSSILAKMNVASRSEAVALAVRYGMIELE
jgi:NarL family two-component system response regulator LiaR